MSFHPSPRFKNPDNSTTG